MAGNRNIKGRSNRPTGVWMQHRILESANFQALSPKAVKLLMQAAAQYRGFNNGDICVTWKIMQAKGWKSKSQLDEALAELMHFGFLELTRQGGRHRPSLYALTWEAIDECHGKLEISATQVASNRWREERPPFIPKRKRKLKSVPRLSGQCAPHIGAVDK